MFFKTHREVAGWMSVFVNFNTIFLFHAVAFHISMAYVFAHGWNWEYISTAAITHSIIKLTAELAMLHFRNLSKAGPPAHCGASSQGAAPPHNTTARWRYVSMRCGRSLP